MPARRTEILEKDRYMPKKEVWFRNWRDREERGLEWDSSADVEW